MGAARGPLSMVAAACGGFNALAKVSYPVFSMEMRGYGGSKASSAAGLEHDAGQEGAFQLFNYLDDFDAVIQASKSKKVGLFGYSHSGYFATAYALAKPENVAALVLVEPALFNERDELLARVKLAQEGKDEQSITAMLRYVQPSVGMQSAAAKRTAKTILNNINDRRTLAGELLARAENPIGDKDISKLAMPVLLIGGTASHVSSIITRLGKLLPEANVWWIRGAQHLDLMSDKYAGQLHSVINSFLASVS